MKAAKKNENVVKCFFKYQNVFASMKRAESQLEREKKKHKNP